MSRYFDQCMFCKVHCINVFWYQSIQNWQIWKHAKIVFYLTSCDAKTIVLIYIVIRSNLQPKVMDLNVFFYDLDLDLWPNYICSIGYICYVTFIDVLLMTNLENTQKSYISLTSRDAKRYVVRHSGSAINQKYLQISVQKLWPNVCYFYVFGDPDLESHCEVS